MGVVGCGVIWLMCWGCASGEYLAPEAAEVVTLPEGWEGPGASGEALEGWCSDMGQPRLDALIDRALTDNFTLLAAWARLEQSQAMARQTDANAWPTVDAGVNGGHSGQVVGGQSGGQVVGGQVGGARVSTRETIGASVGASYEVDLWGRLAKLREASGLEAEASRADVEAIALSLAASVAELWFELVYQRERRALLDAQRSLNDEVLTLTLLRLSEGQGSALDIAQQEQQMEAFNAQLAEIEGAERSARQRLAVLVGRPPQEDVTDATATLPELPPLPGLGVPADLLDHRPDVRRARLRLESADRRTAAAVKDQLPSLRLSADLSVQAINATSLLTQLAWSVGAGLAQPLVDGGRRAAEVERSTAVARERLNVYAQTLLDAMQEVEQALIIEARIEAQQVSLEAQRERAALVLELAAVRYRQGGGDYLRVLTAIQALQQLERTQLDARRQKLSGRVQLCRALGGGWTRRLVAPEREGTP